MSKIAQTQEDLLQLFNKQSHNGKLKLIYEMQLALLTEYGKMAAMVSQILANEEAFKQQMDILANNQFLEETIKEQCSSHEANC